VKLSEHDNGLSFDDKSFKLYFRQEDCDNIEAAQGTGEVDLKLGLR
jgi:hypothetical protein